MRGGIMRWRLMRWGIMRGRGNKGRGSNIPAQTPQVGGVLVVECHERARGAASYTGNSCCLPHLGLGLVDLIY